MAKIFLLGAGASVEAGIPATYDMTSKMLTNFSDDQRAHYYRYDEVLQFVVGGLLFQQGIRGENPYNGVNIEDLFNAVLLLSDRQNSEVSPFISSWHPQLISLESGKLSTSISRELLSTINEPIEKYVQSILSRPKREIDTFFASSRFSSIFSDAVRQVMSGSEGILFRNTANAMIQQLIEMVWLTDSEKIHYLIPLIKYCKKTSAPIVTLNYDNSIELASHTLGIEVDTGFDMWSKSGEFAFRENNIPLIKLHGSIDWALYEGRIEKDKPLPYQMIKKVDPNSKNHEAIHPAIIFGGKNKLTAKGPFLSLLQSFELQLAHSDVLTVIGYSFRDEHVNEFIANWFNGDVNRRIIIIDHKPESINKDIKKYLDSRYLEDRLEIINDVASKGIGSITEK
jgi:NAD-dependent SIR2 family protein deacetylase